MDKLDIVANNYAIDDLTCFNDSILALYKDCYIQGFKRGVEKGRVQKTVEWIKLNKKMDSKELILCENCKYYSQDVWEVVNGVPQVTGHSMCYFWNNEGNLVKETDYCSNAELKGE